MLWFKQIFFNQSEGVWLSKMYRIKFHWINIYVYNFVIVEEKFFLHFLESEVESGETHFRSWKAFCFK